MSTYGISISLRVGKRASKLVSMEGAFKSIDLASHPDLIGVFRPVDDEIEEADLPVIGKIPEDLRGVYLRNGPNPKFPPLGSYTYPLDGDGMIHGVWLADGRARYRNRYVLTKGLQAEIRAGRALWGGLMTPVVPSADLVGPDQDPEGDKLLPGINIVRHAHRFLALGEGTAPYEMTEELATVGRYDFAGSLPLGMCAHPKIDPVLCVGWEYVAARIRREHFGGDAGLRRHIILDAFQQL